jgi:hypothetical protein
MHETLTKICESLRLIAANVDAQVTHNDPFSNGSWSHPGLTKRELIEDAEKIIELIEARGGDELGEYGDRLLSYESRIEQLIKNTIPQLRTGNCGTAVSVYLLTLQGLRKALDPVLIQDDPGKAASDLKQIVKKLGDMKSKLSDLGPRVSKLDVMVEEIEDAHEKALEAADQLPTDLRALSEAQESIEKLLKDAEQDQEHVLRIKETAEKLDSRLKEIDVNANKVLKECESAFSAATSVGLALAFSERASSLSESIRWWIFGLISALGAGFYLGSAQLHSLTDLFITPDVPTSLVLLNLLLSLLSVGAPVWFAWLATKQIGQRFRLSEDYAFKASISRAYMGFRREAADIDKDMEAKLMQSALTRLDELPLRLVETDNHGSPWQEIFSACLAKREPTRGEAPPAAGKTKESAA